MAYIGTAPSRSPLSSTQLDADLTLTDSLTITGSTPTVTIGDAGAEDAKIVFDGNAQDFHIGLDDTDDDLVIGVGAALGTTTAVSVDENAKVKVDVGMLGPLYIGDTANGVNSVGLTINQGAADDEIIGLKSSDVATGLTSFVQAGVETDTFGTIRKVEGVGGLYIAGMKPHDYGTNALKFEGFADGNGLSTTHTSSGIGGINFIYNGHNGSNAGDTLQANGNVFSIRGNIIGGTHRTLFIVDEDGDLFVDGSTTVTAFDAWDDAALLRSYELWREGETEGKLSDQMLKSRFDENKYTKEQLGLTKLIQVIPDETWAPTGPDTEQSLVNTGALARITTGAIWQNHEMLDAIIETMEERDSGFTAALKKKFVARGLPTQILDWDGDIPDDLKKPDTAPAAFNAEE